MQMGRGNEDIKAGDALSRLPFRLRNYRVRSFLTLRQWPVECLIDFRIVVIESTRKPLIDKCGGVPKAYETKMMVAP